MPVWVFLQHPREDSNLDLDVRSVALCPLSYGGQLLLVPRQVHVLSVCSAVELSTNERPRKMVGIYPIERTK